MVDGILPSCKVARDSGIMTLSSPGGSTMQCGTWLWYDMPLNSPKRPPYCISTSGFDFALITAVDMSFYEVLSKSDRPRQINNVCRFSRRRIAAILDFKGHNGFFEKPMYDILYNTIVLYRMSQVHNNNTTAA